MTRPKRSIGHAGRAAAGADFLWDVGPRFARADLLRRRSSVDAFFRQRRPSTISPAPGMFQLTGKRSRWLDRVPRPQKLRLAARQIRNHPATRARRADRNPFADARRAAPVRSRRADRDGRAGRSRPGRGAIEVGSRSDRHRCGWRSHNAAAETRRHSDSRSRIPPARPVTSFAPGRTGRFAGARGIALAPRPARPIRQHRGRWARTARQVRSLPENG
jgi:hypothetical protein